MESKVALVIIATGVEYHRYIRPILESAEKYFIKHVPILFTDSEEDYKAVKINLHPRGYPGATLYRYHAYLPWRNILETYDYVFQCDVDMLFVAPVGEEILADGITATVHAGYVGGTGTPETRRESTAYMQPSKPYYAGGFIGGTSEAFLKMAQVISWNVDIDHSHHITAVWHDESHMNRYLHDNPPAKVLSPSYCCPEDYSGGYGWPVEQYPAKLVALEKGKR